MLRTLGSSPLAPSKILWMDCKDGSVCLMVLMLKSGNAVWRTNIVASTSICGVDLIVNGSREITCYPQVHEMNLGMIQSTPLVGHAPSCHYFGVPFVFHRWVRHMEWNGGTLKAGETCPGGFVKNSDGSRGEEIPRCGFRPHFHVRLLEIAFAPLSGYFRHSS